MPFRIALSGLNAASKDLAVTGNNIANSSTNGFKQSRVEFADIVSRPTYDLKELGGGRGVKVSRVQQEFSQGSVGFTSNTLDLAISGDGFFALESSDGLRSYTRAGSFNADADGNVVSANSQFLQVYPVVTLPTGEEIFNTGTTTDLKLPFAPSPPKETTTVAAELNVQADAAQPSVATFDPNDSKSYNHTSSTVVYDSLGSAHTASMYFVKTATPNTWDARLFVDGNAVPVGGSNNFTMAFDTAGRLTNPATGKITTDSFAPGGGASNMQVTYDFSGTVTQFGSSFSVNNLSQDGYPTGLLTSLEIDGKGIVRARYSNGLTPSLGQVAMARFNNRQGLQQVGDTQWAPTSGSGDVLMGQAESGSFGQIQSGALEASNVDLTAALVNLITAQRNFQANAQVISATDTITQTIINI